MGLLQRIILSRQLFGEMQTRCNCCGDLETIKILDKYADGSFTRKCGCGCAIYRFHEPDQNNEKSYFVKYYIPKNKYKKDYCKMDSFEKHGFKKEGGKYVK